MPAAASSVVGFSTIHSFSYVVNRKPYLLFLLDRTFVSELFQSFEQQSVVRS